MNFLFVGLLSGVLYILVFEVLKVMEMFVFGESRLFYEIFKIFNAEFI